MKNAPHRAYKITNGKANGIELPLHHSRIGLATILLDRALPNPCGVAPARPYEPALTSLCAQGVSYINENLNSSKVKVLILRSVI